MCPNILRDILFFLFGYTFEPRRDNLGGFGEYVDASEYYKKLENEKKL